jgi:hypothetical protein
VNGDKLTRWTAVLAVLAVAAVAALISFRHAVDVVTVHGEPGAVGKCYPVVIDGLIIAASMVLLDAARHREPPPVLAWWMLAAGIGATLAVNVLAGVPSGWLGALIASWPALAFVGCYELLMMLVRASARRARTVPAPAEAEIAQILAQFEGGAGSETLQDPAEFGSVTRSVTEVTDFRYDESPDETPGLSSLTKLSEPFAPVFTDAESAAAEALARSIAGGNPLTPNALQNKFRLTRAEATRVVGAVKTTANGHHAEGR